MAQEVMHNRRILIEFLREVLGLEAEQAEADACKIEHLLSHETSRQIMALVEILQSEDADVRQFLKRFKTFKFHCPSLAECKLCEGQCLVEVDPCPLSGLHQPKVL